MCRLLPLTVVLILMGITVGDSTSPTNLGTNPFSTHVCQGYKCVGYSSSGVQFWVYNENSFTNGTSSDPSSIDDDDYTSFKPITLSRCTNSYCTDIVESVDLQQAVEMTSSPSSVEYNGGDSFSFDYKFQANSLDNHTIEVL